MKRLFPIISFLVVVTIASPSFAGSIKTITLKDGSTLKGKVIQLKDQVYTLQTSILGQIEIHESKITSISSNPNTSAGVSTQSQSNLKGSKQSTDQTQLMMQVQQMQQQLLSDPRVMAEVQNIMQNEEVMKILSDQNFLNDVMSYDQNRLQNNDKVQQLMKNPEMKTLMDKIKIQLEVQDEVKF